jgi:hypothetical protein
MEECFVLLQVMITNMAIMAVANMMKTRQAK